MAENSESSAATETKKIINPRVEIDTSPPFESVKEAVDRFGGSGPWIPNHLLRLAATAHHEADLFEVEKIEEQAMQLERDLMLKEQETLNILKELEAAKKLIEGLKLNLVPDSPSYTASPDLKLENHSNLPPQNSPDGFNLCPVLSPGLMFVELNQAKLNLNKTSGDLAVIQAAVESLNKKMSRTKIQHPNSEGILSLEQNHHISSRKPDTDKKVEMTLCTEFKQENYEVEQFKKMTEASRYEVIKAMTEIERTKNSIRMAEMRLNAAKKMEEAAKAIEAIALSEIKDKSDVSLSKNDGITLSFEEYRALTRKAQQAEDLCKTKFMDTNGIHRSNEARHLEVPILEKFEEISKENIKSSKVDKNSNKYKFRNSHPGHRNEPYETKEKSTGGLRSTTSIGDILSRKLILQQDDVMVERHVENHSEREHISLSQMLREQSRLILHPPKPTADGSVEKQYFVQRKKFGFIQVPIPIRQSKKKTNPLNMR